MPVLRHIYDSVTGTYHDVEVTQEVYDFYRRNTWAIRRNDTRFYAHEIQFSSLKGGLDEAFERFDEFLSQSLDPQDVLCEKAMSACLTAAFKQLSASDQHLLYYLVIKGYSERWYGQMMELHFMTVHNKKKRVLQQLKHIITA